ncbi:RNA polymerase subunit sigma-24 [Opitutaceae bacterium EW11]|nr:RNA polymerase subunit sigma-24 [Opitutaceae bacterium EW11]
MSEFSQQLERHYLELGPMLRAYFRRQRPLAAAADDLLQETFLRAWRERARFAAAVSSRAYLFGIARHVALDALRRLRPVEPLEPGRDVAGESVPDPDERLLAMRRAIDALPEAQREPLVLKLQHELSYAEIADVLGVPVGTVRSRLHYAIERLQALLNPNPAACGRSFTDEA